MLFPEVYVEVAQIAVWLLTPVLNVVAKVPVLNHEAEPITPKLAVSESSYICIWGLFGGLSNHLATLNDASRTPRTTCSRTVPQDGFLHLFHGPESYIRQFCSRTI